MKLRDLVRGVFVIALFFTIGSFSPDADAAFSCGGQSHSNSCGNATNIYPCCPNGGNCTWWAWEEICRNWGLSLPNWGNANTWAAHARVDPRFDLVGGPVIHSVGTATPRSGHVAWVVGASGGSVTVTEENCCVGCAGGVRTVSYPVSKFNSGYVALHGSASSCECSAGQTSSEACTCGSHSRSCGANCKWGAWSACAGPPEICDGIDNDCNGLIDDGEPKTMGSPPPAYAATLVDSSVPRAIDVGAHATAWAEFRNDGTEPWKKGQIWLAARGDNDAGVSGLFSSGQWPAWNIASTLDQDVAVGDSARFTFDVTSDASVSAKLDDAFVLQVAGGADIACPASSLATSIWVGPNAEANADADGGVAEAGSEIPNAPTSTSAGCSISRRKSPPESGIALIAFALLFAIRRRRFFITLTIVLSAIACGGGGDPGNLAPTPPAPIGLTSATPAIVSARGGDVVTLAGSGFAKDTAVKIGNSNAAKIELISVSELRATTPPLWAGPTDIGVSGPGGNAQLSAALLVQALDLRFVQAPTYSLAITNDLDAGADAAAGVDARPSPPVAVAVTDDFDGDGDIDLVTCASGEACHFLQNDGQGNFDDRAQSGDDRFGAGSINAAQFAIGDFDGDGDRDLVLAGPSGPMTIETNDGHAHFTESELSWIQFGDGGVSQIEVDGGAAPLDPVTALAAGDIDGDGKIDLVVGNATPDQTPFRILMNAAGGVIRFTESASGSVPARDWAVSGIGVADVDGNGTADIVVSTPGASDGIEMRLLLGEKSTFSEAHGGLPNVAGAEVTAFSIADLNGDKAVDIIAAGKGQDRLLVNDGTGHFFDSSGTSMPLDDTTATSIMLVDLDRDRDLDLVVGNQTAATRLYLNDGAGVFRDYTPLLPLASSNATWVAAADADGDSDQDIFIVSAAPTTPRLYLSVEKLP